MKEKKLSMKATQKSTETIDQLVKEIANTKDWSVLV